MKLTYDPRYNVAYICLKDKPEQVESIRVSDELVVDMAPDGTVYGIEFLNANKQLAAEHDGAIIVVNEESGQSASLKLPA